MRFAFNPNFARAWEQRGWTYQLVGQQEEAIRSFERAIRLSPFDPLRFSTFAGMGIAFIGLGRFDEAVAAAKKALRESQTYSTAYRCLASALAHLGREAEAREAAARMLELDPNFHISEWTAGRWQAQIISTASAKRDFRSDAPSLSRSRFGYSRFAALAI